MSSVAPSLRLPAEDGGPRYAPGEAERHLRTLLGRAQVAAGHPEDDENDADLGRRFIKARHDFSAALDVLERVQADRDELEMFVSALANADDERDEWEGRDLFRDFRDTAGRLLNRLSPRVAGEPTPESNRKDGA